MCLAIPVKVLEIDGQTARVSVEGVEYSASLMLLENVNPGDFVMLHAGFAIGKVDPREAEETLRLWDEMQNLTRGSG